MFCPQCGNQSAPDANFCSACGATAAHYTIAARKIVRPRHPRLIAGVCSGIAIHYGWNLALVRILFAVFTCITLCTGILFYLAAWVLIPDAQYALPPSRQTHPA